MLFLIVLKICQISELTQLDGRKKKDGKPYKCNRYLLYVYTDLFVKHQNSVIDRDKSRK